MRDRIVRGLGWSTGRTLASFFLQFVTIVVVSRYLTPSEVGIVAVGFGIIQLFTTLSQLGVNAALIQRAEASKDHIGAAFTVALVGSVAFTVAVWMTAAQVEDLLSLPGLATIMPVLSAVVVFHAISGVFEALHKRDMNFRAVAAADFLAIGIGYSLVSIVCAANGLGVWSLVAGHIAGFVTRSVLMGIGQFHRSSMRTSIQAIRDLLRYGIFAAMSGFIDHAAETLDRVIIGSILGSGAAGLFVRGRQIVQIGSIAMVMPLGHVLFPAMSRVQHDGAKLRLVYRNMQSLIALISMPGVLVIFVACPSVVPFLLGENWSEVVAPVQAFAIMLFVRSHGAASAMLLNATGHVRQRVAIEILHFILVIGSILYLAPMGLAFVCMGIVGSMAIRTIILGVAVGRVLKLSAADLLPMLTPGLIVTAIFGVCIGLAFMLFGGIVFELRGAVVFLVFAAAAMIYLMCFANGRWLPQDLISIRMQYLKWPTT